MTTDDKNEWPRFHAELTRKTTEQLALFTDKYDRGVVTLREFLCIISVLYDTTSGMIDADVSTLIANIHQDLGQQVKSLEILAASAKLAA